MRQTAFFLIGVQGLGIAGSRMEMLGKEEKAHQRLADIIKTSRKSYETQGHPEIDYEI